MLTIQHNACDRIFPLYNMHPVTRHRFLTIRLYSLHSMNGIRVAVPHRHPFKRRFEMLHDALNHRVHGYATTRLINPVTAFNCLSIASFMARSTPLATR